MRACAPTSPPSPSWPSWAGSGSIHSPANPLGVTILPLFAIGLVIHLKRELILRDQAFAQFVASDWAPAPPILADDPAAHPYHRPHTPARLGFVVAMDCYGRWRRHRHTRLLPFLAWLHRALVHGASIQSSFRPDREIRRGRQ